MFSIFYQLGDYRLTNGGWQPGLQAKQADKDRELLVCDLDDILIVSCFTSWPSEKLSKSLTKSPIYFKEEKLNFTCWLLNHDPQLGSYQYFFVF